MAVDLSVFGRQTSLIDAQREFEARKQAQQLQQLQVQKLVRGVDLPAPIQIANEIAKRQAIGDIDGANLLAQTAKIYDRGIQVDPNTGQIVPISGYGNAVGSIEATKAGMSQQATSNVDLNMKPRITEQVNRAATSADRGANYTKAQSAIVSFGQKANIVNDNITKARGLIKDHPNLSTGYGQVFGSVPNSKAGELNNYLSTIKANVGFDQLQTMRENSPTGGALGGVSENENALLQAVNGALDPKQTANLDANLENIQKLYPLVMEEKKRSFDQDYGNVTPVGNNPIIPAITSDQLNQDYPAPAGSNLPPAMPTALPLQPQTNSVPQGAKLIGTSGGKKIFQLPNGQHVMEQ